MKYTPVLSAAPLILVINEPLELIYRCHTGQLSLAYYFPDAVDPV
jgi:hypothetical protein